MHRIIVNFQVMGTGTFIQGKQPLQSEILTVPMHQLLVLIATKILAVAKIKDALEQIGFSLTVWPQKDIQRRIKGKAQLVIVPPILYGQFF